LPPSAIIFGKLGGRADGFPAVSVISLAKRLSGQA
jgi:hypothetical protein